MGHVIDRGQTDRRTDNSFT